MYFSWSELSDSGVFISGILESFLFLSCIFCNFTILLCRNISSDEHYARSKLRECEGLVDAILYIVKAAIGKNDIDNKSVENCVCVLRNLSYACQEVDDPNYLKKRNMPKEPQKPGGKYIYLSLTSRNSIYMI